MICDCGGGTVVCRSPDLVALARSPHALYMRISQRTESLAMSLVWSSRNDLWELVCDMFHLRVCFNNRFSKRWSLYPEANSFLYRLSLVQAANAAQRISTVTSMPGWSALLAKLTRHCRSASVALAAGL